ncbi:ABC transporter ATP-binding protein [Candidatus Peregrinibacteria bacterium CG10_big_fil_rev_8_21_14_0_10_49_10]|nr:MAG: ABC transporter ATP-binding protein [Candidatus Peregrinibacteria bacterium CG10_big_fil_rev_8_21_14_0_10_49_10]
MEPTTPYSFECTLPLPIMQARKKVVEALQTEKFGVISEINIAEKLKEKLGMEHSPHIILGACNPQLAHEALTDNPDVALVLPCNVVLREVDGQTLVSAMRPSVALQPFKGLKVQESSCKAEEALSRVFDALASERSCH